MGKPLTCRMIAMVEPLPISPVILMDKLRFVSFNCNGAMKKFDIIADICKNSDIVFLQETWAMPHDLHLFDQIDKDFSCHALSSVDNRQILVGRPHGGLTILWRKKYCSFM